MQTFARIVNGAVFEVIELPDGLQLGESFSAQIAAECVACPGGTTQGMVYSNGGFSAPPVPTLSLAQQAALAGVGGLTIALSGSMTLAATLFPTDPATQAKINAVVTTINTTGDFPGGATTYPMKDASGAWHIFTVPEYKAVAGAIAAFVAANDLIADGNPLDASELPANSVSLTV